MEDFRIKVKLGKGAFGNVYLVELDASLNAAPDQTGPMVFAMKVLDKSQIFEQQLTKYAKTERDILAMFTESNFVVKLYFAFQNSKNVFLLLEYCPCGDLGKYLEEERRFPEEVARIYCCEIILALEYLHKNGVIYRDLKPDNILVAENGHIKLADFGLSKMNVTDDFSTNSFLGTHAYLAPEIVGRLSYGKSVDWYGLGAVLYEFCVGQPPYYQENIEALYANISQGPLQLPKNMSDELKDLLTRLLCRIPTDRLGVNGSQEIKNHPFFEGIDWGAF